MKKLTKIFLAVVAISLVASCASMTGGGNGTASGKKYKLGVLLPTTGKFALYGNSTLKGIQCAAGLVQPCKSNVNFELVVKDSAGDPTIAASQVEAMAKEGVVAIVGDMLSVTAKAAAAKAQELKIPMMSLAQVSGVTETGNYIFRNSMSPREQVDTLVEFSVDKRKLKKFGILYPSSTYGREFAAMFRSAVESKGGKVIFERSYSQDDLRSSDSSKQMGSYTTFGDATNTDSTETAPEKKVSFAIPSGVQALFIPDSYKAVRYLATAIHAESSSTDAGMVMMGVNRWNNPGLVNQGIGMLEGSVFVDGFFRKSSDSNTRGFVEAFNAAYGMEPTILEAQAYDAVKLIGQALKNAGSSRARLRDAIAGIKNFNGATGNITVSSDRETYRRLFILTVKNGSIAELSSASRSAVKETDFPYSSASKANASQKYDGTTPPPDLKAQTQREKYDTTEIPSF